MGNLNLRCFFLEHQEVQIELKALGSEHFHFKADKEENNRERMMRGRMRDQCSERKGSSHCGLPHLV